MRALPLAAILGALGGCNAILGIEEPVEILCDDGSQCPSGFCGEDLACDDSQWALRFGGPGDDVALDVAHFDPDREGSEPGVTIVVGSFEDALSFGEGLEYESEDARDAFVLALDSRGQPLWARQFGGPGEQVATAVDIGPDGEVYVVGAFDGPTDFGIVETEATPGIVEGFLVRLDEDGEPEWINEFGGSTSIVVNDVAFVDVGVTVVGSYTGSFQNVGGVPVAPRETAFSVSYTLAGDATVGGTLPTTETSTGCCITLSESLALPVFAGGFRGDETSFGLMSDGGEDGWFSYPQNGEYTLGRALAPISAIAMVGTRFLLATNITDDVVTPEIAISRVEYIDLNDTKIVRAEDPAQRAYVDSLLTNDKDETYAFGQFEGDLRFVDGPAFDVDHTSLFVAVLDTGFFLPMDRTRSFEGTGDASAGGMAIDGDGKIIIAGGFKDTLSLGNDFGAPELHAEEDADIYIAQLAL